MERRSLRPLNVTVGLFIVVASPRPRVSTGTTREREGERKRGDWEIFWQILLAISSGGMLYSPTATVLYYIHTYTVFVRMDGFASAGGGGKRKRRKHNDKRKRIIGEKRRREKCLFRVFHSSAADALLYIFFLYRADYRLRCGCFIFFSST